MVDSAVRIRPVRIGDASAFREKQLMTGKVYEIEDKIREIINSGAALFFAAGAEGNDIAATVLVDGIDAGNSNAYIKMKFSRDFDVNNSEVIAEALNAVLRYVFFEKKIHKIKMLLSEDSLYMGIFR